jgi:nickel-dependent lactate racemase
MRDTARVNVRLLYGRDGLDVDVPGERTTVVVPAHVAAAPDERRAVVDALRGPVAGPPLRALVRPGQTVAISICDGTRAQPRRLVVPAVLEELSGVVRMEDVVVLVATGTHRGNTHDELLEMLGPEVMRTVRVENHDARDDASLAWVGTLGDDVPVWLNRAWLEADVRITTGFVEPHFFAGFSGGPKMVAPGLAGLETTLVLHDARRIDHPAARWGVTEGNPIHDDVRAIAAATGVDFALDVVLDREQRVVRAFGGELFAMHRAACDLARSAAMRAVDGAFDVVVTSNGGFPLDQNLYQSVKGMSAAAQVVKEGGTIVCAAECRDGFPDHGSYRSELAREPSPQRLADAIRRRERTVPDQWQIQIQAKIQCRARVVMHTSFLGEAELRAAHLGHTDDVGETVRAVLSESGPAARLCVLPEGPATIPYVR